MRKLSLLVFGIAIYSDLSSQIQYYDAINLSKFGVDWNDSRKIYDIRERPDVFKILKYYVPAIDSGSQDLIKKDFKGNPFITFLGESKSGDPSDAGINLLPSSLGGLDVTNLADALAKFLVKRAKQELTIAYFDRFNALLMKYPDLKSVFPDTYIALTLVSAQIYNYQGYLQTLRESFEKDLNAIYVNLPSLIDNHTQFFLAHPELEASLRSGCYIAEGLKDEVHPGQILNDFHADYLDPLNPSLKGSIQTLQLFSASLRDTAFDTESGNYWVSAKQIKQLVNDKITFQIYMGLIYQQAKTFNIDKNSGNHTPIVFKDRTAGTVTLNAILDKVAANLNPVRDFITVISQKTEKLNNLIKEHQKPASDSLLIEQYNNYFQTSLDLLKHCSSITLIPAFKDRIKDDFREEMNEYFDVAQSTSNIVLDITRRNFSSAIVNAVHVYDLTLIKKDNEDSSKKIKKEVASSIFKYGSFMAAIVQAKNSDDIENTIEAFALPQGSSRVKRETPFNVSLNGYAGLFYGHEYIKGIKDNLAFNSYGVTAPIGVSISRGHSIFFAGTGKDGWRDNKLGWSTSLFISIVDVGAIAAYRIKNDSIAQVPTIQLKNIFSPGAYLSIGFPKSPLSFNMGAQVGPNLRKVTDAKNDYSNKTFVRLSASLCVDIPVLNFYTKSN